jgi:hypothetical protein
MAIDLDDHRSLVLWATACAEHVLGTFEGAAADDDRPRKAIEAGRAWVRGKVKMTDARKAAFAAHAAARDVTDAAAKAVARAAGHAAATAHVHTHAPHAAAYAAASVGKAVLKAEGIKAANWASLREREWQREQLAENLVAFAYPA